MPQFETWTLLPANSTSYTSVMHHNLDAAPEKHLKSSDVIVEARWLRHRNFYVFAQAWQLARVSGRCCDAAPRQKCGSAPEPKRRLRIHGRWQCCGARCSENREFASATSRKSPLASGASAAVNSPLTTNSHCRLVFRPSFLERC